MEKFVEMSVARRLTAGQRLLSILASLLPLLAAAYIVMLAVSAHLTTLLPLSLLLLALSMFACYKIFCCFYIDWEYVFVDDEIRFSKIINKSRRRELVTIVLDKAELCAAASHADAALMRNHEYKKHYFTTNTGADAYVIAGLDGKGRRVCVVFEPDERMLESIKFTMKSRFKSI